MLAGVSVDYVVRLEQARGPHPSTQVLTALCRTLRLEPDERDHVFVLAGVTPPHQDLIDLHVRPGILRLIDRFTDLPAMVCSAKSDILAWNAMSAALHGDWASLSPVRRNLLRLNFLPDPAEPRRTVIGGSAEHRAQTTRQSVASLRTAAGHYPEDPGLQTLVRDLLAGSERFRRLWEEAEAGIWRSHTKTLVHPAVGELTLECDSLHVPDTDQTIIVYSAAPGSHEAEALQLLRVIGTEEMQAPAR